MRAHGIAPNAASIKPAPTRILKTERRKSSAVSNKKLKANTVSQENAATDDDETFAFASAPVKSEGAETKAYLQVKEEGETPLSLEDAANLVQYYDAPSQDDGGLRGEQEQYYESLSGNNHPGYATVPTPLNSYSMQDQDAFGFEAPYTSGAMESVPQSAVQAAPSQTDLHQMVLWPVLNNHSGSDSAVILE